MKLNEIINHTEEELTFIANDFRANKMWQDRIAGGRGILSFEYAIDQLTQEEKLKLQASIDVLVIDDKEKYTGIIYERLESKTKYTYEGAPIFETMQVLTSAEVQILNRILREIHEKEGPGVAQLVARETLTELEALTKNTDEYN